MNDPMKVQDSWNTVYFPGSKYKDESAIPFTKTIVKTLTVENLLKGKGLYNGCGNGRNYIPLVEEGLDLIGLEMELESNLRKKVDLLTYKSVNPLIKDYIFKDQLPIF